MRRPSPNHGTLRLPNDVMQSDKAFFPTYKMLLHSRTYQWLHLRLTQDTVIGSQSEKALYKVFGIVPVECVVKKQICIAFAYRNVYWLQRMKYMNWW